MNRWMRVVIVMIGVGFVSLGSGLAVQQRSLWFLPIDLAGGLLCGIAAGTTSS